MAWSPGNVLREREREREREKERERERCAWINERGECESGQERERCDKEIWESKSKCVVSVWGIDRKRGRWVNKF
jgi:hypothetical protein